VCFGKKKKGKNQKKQKKKKKKKTKPVLQWCGRQWFSNPLVVCSLWGALAIIRWLGMVVGEKFVEHSVYRKKVQFLQYPLRWWGDSFIRGFVGSGFDLLVFINASLESLGFGIT